MDYPAKNISKYGVLRMPANGSAFNNIEEIWPNFKDEPRNLRLSLAPDSVSPFGELISTYSVWLVFVINNNIPLWMSIKRENIMLAMSFPGICLE
jgi:hypothetical protein